MKFTRNLRKIGAKNAEQQRWMQRNTSSLSALAAHRIGAHLPTIEHEYKTAEAANELCDNTKRSGAGGTKAGSVGLRLLGQRKYDLFHETFNNDGPERKRIIQKADLRSGPNRRDEGPAYKVIRFPETLCIMCMRKDVPPCNDACETPNTCYCCAMADITPVMEHAMYGSILLVPNDVIRSIICAQCKVDIIREGKKAKRTGIQIVMDGQMMPSSIIASMRRCKQLQINIAYVLRISRLETIEDFGGFAAEGIGAA